MEKLVQVIKFGGSSLAYGEVKPQSIENLMDSPELYVRNTSELRRYAKELSDAWNYLSKNRDYSLVISHGVKQYGHDAVGFIGIVPEVRKYCKFFSDMIVENFREEGLPIEQIDAAKTCKWNGKLKIFEVSRYIRDVRKTLDSGAIPVSWGTVVDSVPTGYDIISGDDCVLYPGLLLRADEAIMYMDVSVCDKNPKIHRNARKLEVVKSCKDLNIDIDKRDKTEGLIGKIKKLELLGMSGTRCQIVDATKEGNIYNSLVGKHVGTLIEPIEI